MSFGSDVPTSQADAFSLRKVANLLPEYVPPPAGKFDPNGHWQQTYTMFLMEGSLAKKVGDFSLKRDVKGEKAFVLSVESRRFANSGFSYFERAELQCRADHLATPTAWICYTKLAQNPGDQAYLQSGRRRNMKVAGGTLAIRDTFRVRRSPLIEPYSNEWTLLEAVQRLLGYQTKQLSYTLVDEYDAPIPGHTLKYQSKQQVTLGNGPAELTAYTDLGPAVIPTTYWLDKYHRLLFVCTGLQAYVLTATNGQVGHCPDQYTEPSGQRNRRGLKANRLLRSAYRDKAL